MISVLTTSRRLSYLPYTLQSIDDAGAASLANKYVFVDGKVDKHVIKNVLPGWTWRQLHPGETPRGTLLSLWRILNTAYWMTSDRRANPNGSLLYFEDDVILCRNAIHAMRLIGVPPGAGFLSFFQQNKNMPGKKGFHRLPVGQDWWGNQALKIPFRSLGAFANEDSTPSVVDFKRDGAYHSDVWLGRQLTGCVLLPTLVRHVGLKTSIPIQTENTDEDAARKAGLHYVGDDFDACTHWAVNQ